MSKKKLHLERIICHNGISQTCVIHNASPASRGSAFRRLRLGDFKHIDVMPSDNISIAKEVQNRGYSYRKFIKSFGSE